jgi:hypothetical protein
VSRTTAAGVVAFAIVLHARVASLLVFHNMTVLVVDDSHLLQILNELEEVLLEFRLVCDRVKISRSDGYRPLKLSSVCDCIIEEDGESSRHDHSRQSWVGATEPLVVDVLTVYSHTNGKSSYSYHILEATREYSH